MTSPELVVGLLDTNLVIDSDQINPDQLPTEPTISAITLAELSVGPLVATTDLERKARQDLLDQTEAEFNPIPFDASAARAFGKVSAALRAAGRKSTARNFDSLIAATAIANDLPLYTANPDDFTHIPDLDLHAVRRATDD